MSTTPVGNYRALAWPMLRALGLRRLLVVAAQAISYVSLWDWRKETAARRAARYAVFHTLQEGRADRRAEVEAKETAASLQTDNARHLERLAYATDLRPALGRVRSPALVLCGQRDAVFAAAAGFYRRGLPQARVTLLPGAGHHPLIDAREESLEIIARFLGCGPLPAES